MKKVLIAVFILSAGAAQAEPVSAIVGAAIHLTPVAIGFLAGSESAKPTPACYSEPLRLVAWKNNPNGYSFTVAGCDYAAKQDQLVLVK